MPHGTPDFQQTSGVNTVYQLTDMAELAARLGSIVAFDRRGDVFFLEDFEHGISRFILDGDGAGHGAYLSNYIAKSGSYSCRLVNGSTGDKYAYAANITAYPSTSRIGFEISFSGGWSAGYFEWYLEPADGSHGNYARIKYNHVTDKLYYLDETDVYVEFASGIPLPVAEYLFNTAKLVINIETGEYVRFILNGITYPLSGKLFSRGVVTNYPQVYSEFRFGGNVAANFSAWVDDWILTQNE